MIHCSPPRSTAQFTHTSERSLTCSIAVTHCKTCNAPAITLTDCSTPSRTAALSDMLQRLKRSANICDIQQIIQHTAQRWTTHTSSRRHLTHTSHASGRRQVILKVIVKWRWTLRLRIRTELSPVIGRGARHVRAAVAHARMETEAPFVQVRMAECIFCRYPLVLKIRQ